MSESKFYPIELAFKSAKSSNKEEVFLRTFDSYSFERSLLSPASAFRFTAPGVDKDLRMSIRSGDTVFLYGSNSKGKRIPIAVGIVDETDTHVNASRLEYVISGRDLMGQFVDNSVVDSNNAIQFMQKASIEGILKLLLTDTRLPQTISIQGYPPTAQFLFQTNVGETKINALQRYLEMANCLVWCGPSGQVILGKPNFSQAPMGRFICSDDPKVRSANNVIDARVRRNVNGAIRKIVTQLQTMDKVPPSSFTLNNMDPDVRALSSAKVGRSVYELFSYGSGAEAYNQIFQIGNSDGAPKTIGEALSMRKLARENMSVLDVELIVEGHFNALDIPYDVDQIYSVRIDDENLNEDLYVYSVGYDLTGDHGMMTHLRLCRRNTICADVPVINGGRQ